MNLTTIGIEYLEAELVNVYLFITLRQMTEGIRYKPANRIKFVITQLSAEMFVETS